MAQKSKPVEPLAEDLKINSEATVEELTLEIQYYFVQVGQNIIEIGKRLIIVKSKLPHGKWKKWLEENFDLSQDTSTNFMNVAKRFGANSETSRNLKFSQMVEMLKLPAGEEEKFIEEQAAQGTPVEKMTIKELRAKIKKYNAKLNSGTVLAFVSVPESDSSENFSSEKPVKNAAAKPVEETPPLMYIVESEEEAVEKPAVIEETVVSNSGGENKLQQFLKLVPELLNDGNLSELIEKCAAADLQEFEKQLHQLEKLSEELQKSLEKTRNSTAEQPAEVEEIETEATEVPVEDVDETTTETAVTVEKCEGSETTIEVTEAEGAVKTVEIAGVAGEVQVDEKSDEEERAAIISALQRIALQDDDKFRQSKQIKELVEKLGFDTANEVNTPDLRKILKAVKKDKGGGE